MAIDYSDHSYRFGIRLKEKEVIDLATELKNFLTKAWSQTPKAGRFLGLFCILLLWHYPALVV